MTDLTDLQRDVLALLAELRSAECATIAQALGISPESAIYALRRLRKRGLLVPSCNNRGARWCAPADLEHAEAVHRARAECAAELERQRKQRQQSKRRRQRVAEAVERVTRITQRIVPAAECAPMHITGPASVWELARAV